MCVHYNTLLFLLELIQEGMLEMHYSSPANQPGNLVGAPACGPNAEKM